MEEGLCGCPGESEMRGWGDGVVKGCRYGWLWQHIGFRALLLASVVDVFTRRGILLGCVVWWLDHGLWSLSNWSSKSALPLLRYALGQTN